jgi:hypothetical protein
MKLLEILAPLLLVVSVIGSIVCLYNPPVLLFFLFCAFVGLAGCILEIVIFGILDH